MEPHPSNFVIAIVEDHPDEAALMEEYCRQFARERDISVHLHTFGEAEAFLDCYQPIYDLVLMDIGLPRLNGMEAARQLRQLDDSVLLIFVTLLAQYALGGYAVDALDFIVKPLQYPPFALKMQRAWNRMLTRQDAEVIIVQGSNLLRVRSSHIQYIEVLNHDIRYHTVNGVFHSYGTLKQIEKSLPDGSFFRCKNCYLVNLSYVQSVIGDNVHLSSGENLRLSRTKRRDFLDALGRYLGGKA